MEGTNNYRIVKDLSKLWRSRSDTVINLEKSQYLTSKTSINAIENRDFMSFLREVLAGKTIRLADVNNAVIPAFEDVLNQNFYVDLLHAVSHLDAKIDERQSIGHTCEIHGYHDIIILLTLYQQDQSSNFDLIFHYLKRLLEQTFYFLERNDFNDSVTKNQDNIDIMLRKAIQYFFTYLLIEEVVLFYGRAELMELSKKIKNFVSHILREYSARTSSPINLGAYINTYINNYTRSLNPDNYKSFSRSEVGQILIAQKQIADLFPLSLHSQLVPIMEAVMAKGIDSQEFQEAGSKISDIIYQSMNCYVIRNAEALTH